MDCGLKERAGRPKYGRPNKSKVKIAARCDEMQIYDIVLMQKKKEQKNNTRDSNVVPHRSTNLARQCLTSLSRREAVLSLWYGRS